MGQPPRAVLIPLMVIALGQITHSGLLWWTARDVDDPDNVDVLEKALEQIGESFKGCKLTEFFTKEALLGKQYKVTYICRTRGKTGSCRFRFIKRYLHSSASISEDPNCYWSYIKKDPLQEKQPATTKGIIDSPESIPTNEPEVSDEATEKPKRKKNAVETTTFGSEGSKLQGTDCNFVGDEYVCD